MKYLLMAVLVLLSVSSTRAQDQQQGPPKPPPPEKRWEKDSEKIRKAVTLTADELSKMKTAFMGFYKDMDALMEKNMGQRPAKEEVEKLIGKRNTAIQQFLSKDKFEEFRKVEKELGPPKPKDRRE